MLADLYVPEARDGEPGLRRDRVIVPTKRPIPRQAKAGSRDLAAVSGELMYYLVSRALVAPDLGALRTRVIEALRSAPAEDPTALAVAGMRAAAAVDPWSRYLTPTEYESALAHEDHVGLSLSSEGLVVASIGRGSPASRAGLRAGDRILRIGGVAPGSRQEAGALLSGPVKTKVAVEVDREGQRLVVRLRRESWDSLRLRAHVTRGGVGIIRFESFTREVGEAFTSALSRMLERGPLARLIIDLRGNPGGDVSGTVQVLRSLMGERTELVLRSRTGRDEAYHGWGKVLAETTPVVVLIDRDSASASELAANAIQLDGGLIAGERSFGKGVAQTFYGLPDGSGLALTTAQFFSKGRSPHLIGVAPTVTLEAAEQAVRASEPTRRHGDLLLRFAAHIAEVPRRGLVSP
jgi:C-terminal peptidase prc